MMLAKTEKLEEESGKKGEPPLTKGEKGYRKMKGHTVARDEMKALMAEGQADDLLAWKVADSGFDISSRTDFFLTPFDEAPLVGNNPFGGKRVTKGVTVNGLIGQLPKEKGESSSEEKEKVKAEALEEVSNPHQSSPHPHQSSPNPHLILSQSGEHEHDKAVKSIFGHPNSHLLGFLVVAQTGGEGEQPSPNSHLVLT